MQVLAEKSPPKTTFLPFKNDQNITITRNSGTVFMFFYFGARYLDPRTSRWVSADPAVSDYIPQMPTNDDARKHNQNLPGMGGVYNLVNLHVYHYAGNNPVKYTDPNGEADVYDWIRTSRLISTQDKVRNSYMYKQGGGGNYPTWSMTRQGVDQTYCNLAVFDVADAAGFNQQALYGSGNRGNTSANAAGVNLETAARTGKAMQVGPERAQELANNGMVVIASWINPESGKPGHMATVTPWSTYNSSDGPMVSNAGPAGWNEVMTASRAFGADNIDQVRYYYDPNQNKSYDQSKILKVLD